MSIPTVRNWLNVIFIIGAAVGMLLYYKGSRDTGTIVILASMVFKFIEVVLRMMKI